MSNICRCRWFLQMSTRYRRHLYTPLCRGDQLRSTSFHYHHHRFHFVWLSCNKLSLFLSTSPMILIHDLYYKIGPVYKCETKSCYAVPSTSKTGDWDLFPWNAREQRLVGLLLRPLVNYMIILFILPRRFHTPYFISA